MWPFRKKTLEEVLNATADIVAGGAPFKIKKIDALSFMEGTNAIAQVYQTYEDRKDGKRQKTDEEKLKDIERAKKHFADVFLASVVEPKLCRKKEDGGVGSLPVENLFTDWNMVQELYTKIMEFTYGKKKVSSTSRKRGSQIWT